MSLQRGGNGGIGGSLINIVDGPTFQLKVAAWEVAQGVQSMPVAGRGDSGAWVPTIGIGPGGSVVVSGTAQFKQPPTPADFQGRSGTITEIFHTSVDATAKYDTPVRIDRAAISLAADPQDGWTVTLTGTVTGFPTISGFVAGAPAAVGADAIDKELFSGLTKLIDPKALIDEGSRTFIVRPIANSDAAENTKIAALIAAAVAPFSGAKVKFARLEPGRMVDMAVFSIAFARTDTEEDVINPATATTIDDNKLVSEATSAGVFSSPVAPGGDFVERTSTTQELHDGATKTTKTYGLLDTKQDIEFPGTVSQVDPYEIAGNAIITSVHNSSTAPADPTVPLGELVQRETVRINRVRWKTIWSYEHLNSEQKIEFPGATIETDPQSLADDDVQQDVTSSSTPPADPSPRIADLKIKRRVSRRVGGTPEKWLHRWEFTRNDTKDAVEVQGAYTGSDPSDLGETAVIRRVTNSATPPTTPTAPVGVLVETRTEPLTVANGSYTGRWVHTFEYGPTTKLQKIEFDGDLIVDPALIQDADVIPVVSNSSTAPTTPTPRTADLKLVRRRARRIQGTPEKWVHVFEFARNNSEDEIELDATRTSSDPDDFNESGRIGVIHNSSTGATLPAAPVGLLVEVDVKPLTVPSGSYTGLWLHTFIYGNTTRKQAIEQEGDLEVDPALLDGDDAQTLTNDSSTPPSTPTARLTNQVLARRISRRIQNTPEKWRHQFIFAYRTSAQKLAADRTETNGDTSVLESTATTAAVWLVSGGAPAAPTLSGYELRFNHDVETNNPLYRLRVYKWGLRTTKQDIEFLQSKEIAEAGALKQRSIKTRVTSSATPDSTGLNPDTTNLSELWSETHQITATQYVHVFEFGPLTPTQDVEADGSLTVDDPVAFFEGDTRARQVTSSSTPPATPTVTDRFCVRRTTRRIGKTKYQHDWTYALRDNAAQLEADRTETRTDTSALESTAVTADVWLVSGGSPSTPTLSGYALRFSDDVEVANPLYRLRVYRWGLRTTQQDIEYLKSESTAEAGTIAQRETVVRVQTSATPDATGLNPDSTNLSLYWSQSHRETSGKWVHAFEFRPLTALEDMTAQYERDEIDPAFLGDEHTRVLYGATSTPATAPTVSGQVHTDTIVQRVGKAKYRYVYKFGYRTSVEKLEADRTRTVTDPQGITSSAVTADVWTVSGGAPTAPTLSGMKLVEYEDLETPNPLYRLRIYRWGKRTSKDQIEQEGSFYEFDQFRNISYRIRTVETTADSLATIAATLRTTYKNDITFDSGRVERLNDGQIIKTLDFIDAYEIFDAVATGGYHQVPCIFNGASVKVWVSDVVQSAGQWWVCVEPVTLWYAEMTFSLRKRRGTSTIPLEMSLFGTRNASAFLGIPAGYAGYIGARPRTNRSVAAPHVMDAVFDFRFSSHGIFEPGQIPRGWKRFASDPGISANSYVNVSVFGGSGGGLPTADYSVFLT